MDLTIKIFVILDMTIRFYVNRVFFVSVTHIMSVCVCVCMSIFTSCHISTAWRWTFRAIFHNLFYALNLVKPEIWHSHIDNSLAFNSIIFCCLSTFPIRHTALISNNCSIFLLLSPITLTFIWHFVGHLRDLECNRFKSY